MKRFLNSLFFLLGTGVPGHTATVFYTELPYFSAADSPFYAGIQAGTIYLEDFEDHQLNTPHVISWDSPRIVAVVNGMEIQSQQIGRTHLTPLNRQITWSVDGDDGLNDGFTGLLGDTWTTLNQATGQIYGQMQFRFERDELGRLPTYVGFVVTEALDPFSEVEFVTGPGPESPEGGFDPLSWIPQPNSFPGDTRQHRFFGLYAPQGIDRLDISNVRQIDHLQYGYAIPEPSLSVLVMGALGLCSRRRRSASWDNVYACHPQ